METQEKVEVTEVVFRRFKYENKEVIALFPYESEGNYKCSSYMHVGQHSGADYSGVIQATIPAKETDQDVIDLKKELIGRGYNLRVIRRGNSSKMRVAHRAANRN